MKKSRRTWWHWIMSRRRLSIAEYNAKQWRKEACKFLRELHKEEKRFQKSKVKFQESFDKKCEKSQSFFDRAESLVERYLEVEEALTSELNICKENIIPTQALGLESLRSMVESSIELEQQRKASYRIPPKTGE